MSQPGGAGEPDLIDVAIIGAGISGIDAAYRLTEAVPELTYTILEARERVGGTWDLFRYPGIRSDSDIFTFSFPFHPWRRERSIADGADIRAYIESTAEELGIDEHIRFGAQVQRADFDSDTDRWTVTYRSDDQEVSVAARFLYFATGYYDYHRPYTPSFPGSDDFAGTIIHPQFWPEDLDVTGQRIVVIGSGATAITLLPTLAKQAASVTMLQRSPSYIVPLPAVSPITPVVQKYLPAGLAHKVLRQVNAASSMVTYEFCRRAPDRARKVIRSLAARDLPADFDVDTHLNPTYAPWDQRVCLCPNGDFFRAIRKDGAQVVTDTIDHFDATGIALTSGEHLDADIIVTATGLRMQSLGGVTVSVDGDAVDLHERFVYRGHMIDGLPNAAWAIGYTNASWTLRCDITARTVGKLLAYMRTHGYTRACPDSSGTEIVEKSLLGLESGYVQRAVDELPRAGTKRPWTVRQNYYLDSLDARFGKVTDSMVFSRIGDRVTEHPTISS